MQWVIGALIVVVGITLVIAGAQGTGAQLFQSVTGKAPAAQTTASTTAAGSPGAVLASAVSYPYSSAPPGYNPGGPAQGPGIPGGTVLPAGTVVA